LPRRLSHQINQFRHSFKMQTFLQNVTGDIPFDIDVYVTTVDGNDPLYLKKMEQRISEERWGTNAESTGKRRINDYGEIRLLLDSIEYNMPWVRYVHLCVHDDQTPAWVKDTAFFRKKIIVHEHSSYFDNDITLPTFNSFVIDTQVKNVPGLAEHFIFMENDMFIPKPLSADRFFAASGLPRLNCIFWNRSRYQHGLIWQDVYLAENQHCAQVFGHLCYNEAKVPAIDHGPLPSLMSVLLEAHGLFEPWIAATKNHSFRHKDDISYYLFRLMHIYTGRFARSRNRNFIYSVSDMPDTIESYLERDTVCLNDDYQESCGETFILEAAQKIANLRKGLCEVYRTRLR
jgi:hypothetical protein